MKNTSGLRKSSTVRSRALIIGTVLIPINCYWVVGAEIIRASIHATVLSIFFNVVFAIFVLALLNLFIKKYRPTFALSSVDLLVIYVMLSASTALHGIDTITLMVPFIGHAFWFATPENEWKELFWRYLPEWLTVDDKNILRGYYEGGTSFWAATNIQAWCIPVISWSLFIFFLVLMMLCINVIIRKQWTEHEKLSYPIIQLPLEMTAEHSAFFKNRLMWGGFAVAFVLEMIQAIHAIYPVVPAPRLRYNLAPLFTTKPWNAIGWMPVKFFPFVVGLAYFMPLDLSFSTWFFYLFWKAQNVFRSAVGWGAMGGGRYLTGQSSGAWLSIGILALWTSRKHISSVFGGVMGRKALEDSDEPMRYRTAVLILIGSVAFLLLFCYKAGMSIWLAVPFFIIYFTLVIAASRMRAELGPPTHDLVAGGADRILTNTIGTRIMGPRNLTIINLLYWTSYDYRCHPMPHQLEGFKIAERTRINNKRLAFAMMLATAVGIVSSFSVLLSFFYQYGGTVRVSGGSIGPSWEAFNRLKRLMTNPITADYPAIRQRSFGMILTIFLMIMRRRFLWWKLHPVGYAVSGSWTMSHMWFSVFLSWLIKGIILRHGGLKIYRCGVPFFLGLIVGQFLVGSFWSIVGVIFDIQVYRFFP
jgi:hypothetical protein